MIWQNVWAWAGLVTLGIPVLIHLLGRDRAPRHSFPTLRFLETADLLPTRRTRVHDAILLAVRLAILIAAVAAIAQPFLMVAGRTQAVGDRLARAIIVDTSASMLRTTPSGERALDAARREATRLAGKSRPSVVLETARPSRAIHGAVAWLSKQASRREIVVVSDFQLGTIDTVDVAAIPVAIGVRPSRIEVRTSIEPMERRLRVGDAEITTRLELANDRVSVGWSSNARDTLTTLAGVTTLIASALERPAADASMDAARTIPVELPVDTGVAIAVVFPGAEQRADLLRGARPLRSTALIEIAARIRADSLLTSAAAAAASVGTDSTIVNNRLTVASNADGTPIVVAAADSAGGRERLLLFSLADAGSLASAALIAAARRALSSATPVAELEPSTIAAAVVGGWQRAPSDARPSDMIDPANGPSDGRWLWLLVLALLGLEAWLRRARPVQALSVVEHVDDRAA